MLRSSFVIAALAAFALFCCPRLQAATHNESGDAGDLPGTAQVAGSNIDLITGTLTTNDFVEIDMFQIDLPAGTFLFETRSDSSNPSGGTLSDPNLFLFNAAGNPLAGADDSATSPGGGVFDSGFQLSLAAGTYYVAIGENNTDGLGAGFNLIVSNDIGVADPNGVIANWLTEEGAGGTYQILITTVPEPSSLVLAGVALGTLGVIRRRMRKADPNANAALDAENGSERFC